MRTSLPTAFALCLWAAAADASPRPMLSHVGPADERGVRAVEAMVFNEDEQPEDFAAPPEIEAIFRAEGVEMPVVLERASDTGARVAVAPHGFAKLRYTVRLPRAASVDARLTVRAWSAEGLALSDPPATRTTAATPRLADASPVGATQAPVGYEVRYRSADDDHGNAFLPNLTAYEPVYAVYGPGTDTDARLQISFKYQLFGDVRDGRQSWIDGIHFAFTQRLYWNLGAESSPFRNVDYLPELFYLMPARPISSTVTLGGQGGFRHESNGRGGLDSRSFNTVYIQPVASLPIGDYKLSLGPRLWLYAGSREDNPDIRRYRGNTGLFAEIGRDDGWRLTTTSRFNIGTGKGAIDALLSYPLDRLISGNLKLYAFGQGFAGYGENLLDYDRRTTRLRVGIGIVR